MHWKHYVAAVALTLLPAAASAKDYRIQYDVDAMALKAAVDGTPLTISLYADEACSNLVDSQLVNIEDVGLIEVLKRFTAKGATKPPKTARIWHTYSLSPSRWFARATVTGTGVTPVGGACQPQESGMAVGVKAGPSGGPQSITTTAATLTSLTVDVPTDGVLTLVLNVEMNAIASGQYIDCQLREDLATLDAFDLDTGDADGFSDLQQSRHVVIQASRGTHNYEAYCRVNAGSNVSVSRARLIATFIDGAL